MMHDNVVSTSLVLRSHATFIASSHCLQCKYTVPGIFQHGNDVIEIGPEQKGKVLWVVQSNMFQHSVCMIFDWIARYV